MRERLIAFMTAVDASLVGEAGGETLKVYHIGRSSLVWRYDYAATTGDIDILRPTGSERLLASALKQFGRGTPKAVEHGLYLEVVEAALPPVPTGYERRATRANGPWRVLELYHLEPHDLAATKLRRFAAKDREDIRMLCDRDLLDPDRLEEILEKAFWFSLEKDGDEFRDAAFESLRVVQKYLRGEISEF